MWSKENNFFCYKLKILDFFGIYIYYVKNKNFKIKNIILIYLQVKIT